MDKQERTIKFLKELKSSYHKNEIIYSKGSCFRLFCILKLLFEEAKPFYSESDGHWITEIEGSFYDINGEIDQEYVKLREYREITDSVTLTSAYIPTYKRQTTRYDKYKGLKLS